jgi:Mg-chelatase subunit ChlD
VLSGKGRGTEAKVRGSAAPGFTEETGTLLTAPAGGSADPVALARAREIATRLALPQPMRQRTSRRGPGELSSVPWRGSGDEIDLDATMETLVADPYPQDEDLVVREYLRHRRAIVVLIDVSGSMRGERVRTAAATVGALAGEFAHDSLSVVAFGSDATLLVSPGERVEPVHLLDVLLSIPAKGLTNVEFPLKIARDQLARSSLREHRVLLLSDCVHNAGPDPRGTAARLPRLDVLVDTSGEHDLDLARDLARMGRGRVAAVAHHRQVAPALSRFFAG